MQAAACSERQRWRRRAAALPAHRRRRWMSKPATSIVQRACKRFGASCSKTGTPTRVASACCRNCKLSAAAADIPVTFKAQRSDQELSKAAQVQNGRVCRGPDRHASPLTPIAAWQSLQGLCVASRSLR